MSKRKNFSFLRGRTQRVGAKFEARPTQYVKKEETPASKKLPSLVPPADGLPGAKGQAVAEDDDSEE